MNYCHLNKLVTLLSIKRFVECRNVTTKTLITADGKEVPKRKNYENRITLIGNDNTLTITDLKNAQNLSARRELKLVKVQDVDSKTRRPVYKLLTNAEYHAEELSRRKEKQISKQNSPIKGDKLLTLSSRIGEHDLMTGVRKMVKLVEKQYEVRVVITGDDAQALANFERIYSVIENNLKSVCKVVQKRTKGNSLRFQLLPIRAASTDNDNSDTNPAGPDKGPL